MDMENRDQKNIRNEGDQVVAAFEQILEVMPDDLFALEALHDAHLANGETEKALEYLYRIADIVQKNDDEQMSVRVSDKLLFLAAEHPEAESRAAVLLGNCGGQPSGIKPLGVAGETPRKSKINLSDNIRQEIALAWRLFESGRISKSDYSEITNDLTEMSSKEVSVPVTVMHVLHDRAVANLEKIVAYIAKDSGTPLISLSSFDVQIKALQLLSFEYLEKIGALPFDFINEDAMVAILNPYNADLKEAIGNELGRSCHFYLVTAPDYDNTLNSARKLLSDTGVE